MEDLADAARTGYAVGLPSLNLVFDPPVRFPKPWRDILLNPALFLSPLLLSITHPAALAIINDFRTCTLLLATSAILSTLVSVVTNTAGSKRCAMGDE